MLGAQRVTAIETLPQMVITATRSERQPFNTPQAVSIISEEEIERLNQRRFSQAELTPNFRGIEDGPVCLWRQGTGVKEARQTSNRR